MGSVFARDFRVLGLLATGGMGSVYRVEQLSTHKRRALKILHGRLDPDDRSHQRFEREATVGAKIDSEHIVEVVAAGVDEETALPWLAMELLDGLDLANLVARQGPLPPEAVRAVVRQVCHGLGAAHEVGVVHRDLKPENIFVARPRHAGTPFTVKILDFGIAKLVHDAGGTDTAAVGSPMWMAPEQLNNERLSPATDVWALGLVAFWALTGKPYWKTAQSERYTVQALFAEQLLKSLSPASERAAFLGCGQLPEGFDDWYARCVVRDQKERFAEARRAADALAEILPEAKELPELLPDENETPDPHGETMVDTTGGPTVAEAELARDLSNSNVGTALATRGIALTSTDAHAPAYVGDAPLQTKSTPAQRRGRLVVAAVGAALVASVATATALLLTEDRRPGPSAPADPPQPQASAESPGSVPIPVPHELRVPPLPEALQPIKPLRTQLSFASADAKFDGWLSEGARFALSLDYDPAARGAEATDRAQLIQIHDSLTGLTVESYLVGQRIGTGKGSEKRAAAAAEAEPYSEWEAEVAGLAFRPEPSPVRPGGGAKISVKADAAPSGTKLRFDTTASGQRFVWSGLGELSDDAPALGPGFDVRLVVGEEVWTLLSIHVPFETDELRERGIEEVHGELEYHWSPDGSRFVVISNATGTGASGAPVTKGRWFLRATGPPIRLIDGGAGQRALRRKAADLAATGLPVAAAELAHAPVDHSEIYYRARQPKARAVAERINAALGGQLELEEIEGGGWTLVIVVLGGDEQ